MSPLESILINLCSTAIGILISLFWQKSKIWKIRNFWKGFLGKVRFVLHRYPGDEWVGGKVSIHDTVAVTELRLYFENLKVKDLEIEYANDIHGDKFRTYAEAMQIEGLLSC